MQPRFATNDTDDVMHAVAAIHPAQTVVDQAFRQAKAADRLELSARRGRIGCCQVEVVHPARSDTMGRVPSSIKLVGRWRMYLETQPLGRRESYSCGHTVKAGFARKNPAAGGLDPGLRFPDGFDGERFQPDRMCRVLLRPEQHQLGRASVGA